MSETSPIAAVHALAWTDTPLPPCAEHDHTCGHLCLPLPGHVDLTALVKTITDWYGQPTTVDAESSHPLLAPFAEAPEPVARMHAWPCNKRWIGCGITRSGNEDRVVLLLADRITPAAQSLPEGLSWVERIVAITGWADGRHQPAPHAVDWTAVEQRLGTALPDDYKQIAEIFGCGAFNEYLQIYVPDAQLISYDLVRTAEQLAKSVRDHNRKTYEPYSIHPEQGGLLGWRAPSRRTRPSGSRKTPTRTSGRS